MQAVADNIIRVRHALMQMCMSEVLVYHDLLLLKKQHATVMSNALIMHSIMCHRAT